MAGKKVYTGGLRIGTRCETVDDFIKKFHRFCEGRVIFIPQAKRPVGGEAAFSFDLTDGRAALCGVGIVLEQFTDAQNRYGRPGIVLELRQLRESTRPVLEQMSAMQRTRQRASPDARATPPSQESASAPVSPRALTPIPSYRPRAVTATTGNESAAATSGGRTITNPPSMVPRSVSSVARSSTSVRGQAPIQMTQVEVTPGASMPLLADASGSTHEPLSARLPAPQSSLARTPAPPTSAVVDEKREPSLGAIAAQPLRSARSARMIESLTITCACAGQFVVSADSRSVIAAVPELSQQFAISIGAVQWLFLAYQLTFLTLSVAISDACDRLGRKRVYVWGFGLFLAGQLVSGTSGSYVQLLGARAVSAAGALIILTTGRTILAATISPERRGWAIGLCMTAMQFGWFAGPAITGLAIDNLGWRSLFLVVSLPIAVLAGAMAIWVVPATASPPKRRFDVTGMILYVVAIVSLVAGLYGLHDGVTWQAIAYLSTFVVFAVMFWFFERSTESSLLDTDLVSRKPVAFGLTAIFLCNMALGATMFLVPLYLKGLIGYSETRVGLVFTAMSVASIIAPPVIGHLSGGLGGQLLQPLGCWLMAIGAFAVSFMQPTWSQLSISLALLVFGLGMSIFATANLVLIIAATPNERLGAVSSLSFTFIYLGHTVAVPFATMLLLMGVGATSSLRVKDLALDPAAAVASFQRAFIAISIIAFLASFLRDRRSAAAA